MNNISFHKIASRFQDYLVRFSTCTETLLNYINSIINSKFKFSNESNVDDCLAPADTRIFLSVFSFSLFFHSLCRSFVIFNLLCRFLSILNFVVDQLPDSCCQAPADSGIIHSSHFIFFATLSPFCLFFIQNIFWVVWPIDLLMAGGLLPTPECFQPPLKIDNRKNFAAPTTRQIMQNHINCYFEKVI